MSDIDDRLREELGALLDGALDEERAAELRLRLETDEALRKEYDELRLTLAAVRALPRARAPAELHARVQRELARPAGRLFTLRRALAVAAVLAVAVTASVLATRGDESPPAVFEEAARRQPAERDTPPKDLQPKKSEEFRVRRFDEVVDREEPEEEGELEDDAAASEAKLDEVAKEAPPVRKRSLEVLKRESRPEPAQPEAESAADRAEAQPSAGGKAGRGAAAPIAFALLSAVESGKELAAQDRLVYLAGLNQLPAPKATAHLAAFQESAATVLMGAVAQKGLAASVPPTVASVVVSDLAEARQMYTFLRARYPVTTPSGPNAAEMRAGNTLLTAEVEVTPQEWRQVGGWLQFMSMDRKAKSRAGLRAAEEKGRAGKSLKKAKAPKAPATPDDDKGERADRKKKAPVPRRVRIQIRYAPPPKPERK